MNIKDIDIEKLRKRFAEDKNFSEKFFALSTELSDFTIDEISTDPKMKYNYKNDPGLIIVMMKGHLSNGHPFIMVLLEPHEYISGIMRAYVGWLWGPYDPVTDEDFGNLPDIYEITFDDKDTEAPERPILHVRTHTSYMKDGEWVPVDCEVNDGVFINLINVNAEKSEILEMIKDSAISK